MPAPVSTNPSNTDEPATDLADRLSFDLRLLIATVLLSLRAFRSPYLKELPRRLMLVVKAARRVTRLRRITLVGHAVYTGCP